MCLIKIIVTIQLLTNKRTGLYAGIDVEVIGRFLEADIVERNRKRRK